MSRREYQRRFASDALADFPMLNELATAGHLQLDREQLVLTESGVEHSDAIGPWLNSSKVKQLEASYPWR
jgi:oxygen-independent coproporphyrinogen-3 oxidase